jgi:hypothetical protein
MPPLVSHFFCFSFRGASGGRSAGEGRNQHVSQVNGPGGRGQNGKNEIDNSTLDTT